MRTLPVCLLLAAACAGGAPTRTRTAGPPTGTVPAAFSRGEPVRISYFRFVEGFNSNRQERVAPRYIVLQSIAYTMTRGTRNPDVFAGHFAPVMGQGIDNDLLADLAQDMIRGGYLELSDFDSLTIPAAQLRDRTFSGTVIRLETPGVQKTVMLAAEDRAPGRMPRAFFEWETRISELASEHAMRVTQTAEPLQQPALERGSRARVSFFRFRPFRMEVLDERDRPFEEVSGIGVEYRILQTASDTWANGIHNREMFQAYHPAWIASEVPDDRLNGLIQQMVREGALTLPDFDPSRAPHEAIENGTFGYTVVSIDAPGVRKRFMLANAEIDAGRGPRFYLEWERRIRDLVTDFGAPPASSAERDR